MSKQGLAQATQVLMSWPWAPTVRHIDWVVLLPPPRWAWELSRLRGPLRIFWAGANGQRYWQKVLPP